jgi:hypothetical protein
MKVFLILALLSPVLLAEAIPDYSRSQWRHWIDSDSDCLDTRHELLVRESLEPVIYKTVNNCRVITGKWYGPYLGKFFTVSSDFDLDHVIPLKWAHIHGGWRWSKDLKRQFANDYLNLVLVDKGRNRSKGGRGPGEWMPDNSAYHCDYAFRWSYLVDKYNLSVNQVDGDKISEVANSCNLN